MLVRKYSPDYYTQGLEYIDSFLDKTRVFRVCLELITGKARR